MSKKLYFKKEDIGIELLPILTEGIYRNKLDALREYIQNSIDAKCQNIHIKITPNTVIIEDDGTGMNFTSGERAIRLGISDKNPNTDVGFRGIGIYSAYNLCNELEMLTYSDDEKKCNRIYFNFGAIREDVGKETERKRLGIAAQTCLEDALNKAVSVEQCDECFIDKHGTRVILSGIRGEVYKEINDQTLVVHYLQDTVPLPFDDSFKHASALMKEFNKYGLKNVNVFLSFNNLESIQICRPYYDSMFTSNIPGELKIDKIQDFGFAWVCHNSVNRVLPDDRHRGILIKKKGFSISDRAFLARFFSIITFNRRITGEIIITNDDLIPNAARSDFEHNAARDKFLLAMRSYTTSTLEKWMRTIQNRFAALEKLNEVRDMLAQSNSSMGVLGRDKEDLIHLRIQLGYATGSLEPHRKLLKELKKELYEQVEQNLKALIKDTEQAIQERRTTREKAEKRLIDTITREKEEQEISIVKPPIPNDILDAAKEIGISLDSEGEEFLNKLNKILESLLEPEQFNQLIKEILKLNEA